MRPVLIATALTVSLVVTGVTPASSQATFGLHGLHAFYPLSQTLQFCLQAGSAKETKLVRGIVFAGPWVTSGRALQQGQRSAFFPRFDQGSWQPIPPTGSTVRGWRYVQSSPLFAETPRLCFHLPASPTLTTMPSTVKLLALIAPPSGRGFAFLSVTDPMPTALETATTPGKEAPALTRFLPEPYSQHRAFIIPMPPTLCSRLVKLFPKLLGRYSPAAAAVCATSVDIALSAPTTLTGQTPLRHRLADPNAASSSGGWLVKKVKLRWCYARNVSGAVVLMCRVWKAAMGAKIRYNQHVVQQAATLNCQPIHNVTVTLCANNPTAQTVTVMTSEDNFTVGMRYYENATARPNGELWVDCANLNLDTTYLCP